MYLHRYVNENGTRYYPTRSQNGPYGSETVFTGPKVYMKAHDS